jgi:hypothetical protein
MSYNSKDKTADQGKFQKKATLKQRLLKSVREILPILQAIAALVVIFGK